MRIEFPMFTIPLKTWLLASAGCAALAMGGPGLAAEPPAIKVVATFSILGDMAKQIGGERVKVDVLVGPGGDAHVFQPKPTDAKTVGAAQVVFANGLGFEGWMARLLKAANPKLKPVLVSQGIQPQKTAGGQHAGHSHHPAADPHAWQSLPNAQVYVNNMANALCDADPTGCTGYRQRATAYTRQLEKLHADNLAAWAHIPSEQRKVITHHDAFGYYASTYGVQFLSPQGMSTESEASAKAVAQLVRQIKREKVRALFVENVSDPRLVEQIARETGIKPAGELFSDSLSPAGGPAATYLDMMRHNTRVLTEAIQPKIQ
jgi:zinc/manganese transport system substrate-binding protein